jgi:osmotically inducible lipoprotein OsmB
MRRLFPASDDPVQLLDEVRLRLRALFASGDVVQKDRDIPTFAGLYAQTRRVPAARKGQHGEFLLLRLSGVETGRRAPVLNTAFGGLMKSKKLPRNGPRRRGFSSRLTGAAGVLSSMESNIDRKEAAMRILRMITVLVMLFTLSACAHMTQGEQNLAGGALVGGALGAGIGAAAGSPAAGAAIGGAAGLVGGALINEMDRANNPPPRY